MNTSHQYADTITSNPAFAESAAHLADLLRGLVIRWETLDFSASANCFGMDQRMQAWSEAECIELLPVSYARQ
jgi:hypothetical protein